MNIVVSINNKYIEAFEVFAKSLDNNIKSNYNLHIFCAKELDQKKILFFINKNLLFINEIKFYVIEIPKEFIEVNSKNIDYSSYLRILIPDYLPEIKKALFLDVDIIVKKDITKLYNLDISKYNLAAAKDNFSRIINFTNLKKKYPYYKEINMKHFFNAGVLLMNLENLRKISLFKKSIEFIRENKPFMHDQDVLNYFIQDKVKKISPLWNWGLGYNTFRWGLIFRPKIIHYQGMYKPWETKRKNKIKFILYWGILRYKLWYKYKNKIKKK